MRPAVRRFAVFSRLLCKFAKQLGLFYKIVLFAAIELIFKSSEFVTAAQASF